MTLIYLDAVCSWNNYVMRGLRVITHRGTLLVG